MDNKIGKFFSYLRQNSYSKHTHTTYMREEEEQTHTQLGEGWGIGSAPLGKYIEVC